MFTAGQHERERAEERRKNWTGPNVLVKDYRVDTGHGPVHVASMEEIWDLRLELESVYYKMHQFAMCSCTPLGEITCEAIDHG